MFLVYFVVVNNLVKGGTSRKNRGGAEEKILRNNCNGTLGWYVFESDDRILPPVFISAICLHTHTCTLHLSGAHTRSTPTPIYRTLT